MGLNPVLEVVLVIWAVAWGPFVLMLTLALLLKAVLKK